MRPGDRSSCATEPPSADFQPPLRETETAAFVLFPDAGKRFILGRIEINMRQSLRDWIFALKRFETFFVKIFYDVSNMCGLFFTTFTAEVNIIDNQTKLNNNMKKLFSLIGVAAIVSAAALSSCQKQEADQFDSSEVSASAGTRASSFSSIFGIDWSKVTVENSASDYPAFKTMKVTADAKYLYLYFTADPSKMKSGHAYDNVLNVYLYDSSASTNYWQQKAVNVAAMGGWLMKKSQPRFTSWGSDVSSQAVDVNGTYYYEIRYPRSISPLLSKSSAHVGLYMNNNYQRTDGSYASSYSKVGIRPNKGSNMYWLSLPGASSSPALPVMGSVEFSKKLQNGSDYVPELSGLCLSKGGDFLWGVHDKGTLYKIYFDGTYQKVWYKQNDFEALAMNPSTGDLYIGLESSSKSAYKIPYPNYNSIVSTSVVVEGVSSMGNSGVEGLAWYKGDLLFGTQTGATLFQYSLDGKLKFKKSLKTVCSTITEIGGMDYDAENDWLWVIDSNTASDNHPDYRPAIYLFKGLGEKHLKTYYIDGFANWNPEAICVDKKHGCIWVGEDCDSGYPSRLHKVKFSNL